MSVEDASFSGRRGRRIVYRGWSPAGDQPRASVVLTHGFGEHGGRYEHVAARLNEAGFAVYAPDHHGHGRSAGTRAAINFDDAVADIDTVADRALVAHPGLPLFIVGHSMGGALALRYALSHGERLSGLVLSGPLTATGSPAPMRTAAKLLGRLVPRAPTVRLDPKLVSRDPQVVAAYVDDPLVWHGAIPAGTAAEFARHEDTIFQQAASLSKPTLLMYGSRDGLCPPAASARLGDTLGAEDLTVRAWDGLFHEIFNEPEQEAVLGVLCDWLVTHTS